MSIIKNALKKEIDKDKLLQFNDTTATILEYDIVSNTATIRFLNPNGDGYMLRKNVNVSNTMGGHTGAGIIAGQICNISFINNNIFNPIITGMLSNNYKDKTSSDQGAFLVSNAIFEAEEPEKITPMIETWLDKENQNKYKYKNELGDYTEVDATKKASESVHTLDKYKNQDEGMTHLKTKSTVKLKENGDIDIFVAGNLGIRISPNDKSINVYGTFKVNNKTIDFNELTKEE